MHGSLCSIKFTWQQNYSRRGLREITKSLKSELLWGLLCMLVLVITEITKIHGLKDDMAYFKTHVELMLKRCTDLMIQKWQISKFCQEPENNSNYPSSNERLGIKMTSNENGAIEQNEEHHEANNLTYYTHESELHARSSSIGNRGTCWGISRT